MHIQHENKFNDILKKKRPKKNLTEMMEIFLLLLEK
jgi:hypothetical protein